MLDRPCISLQYLRLECGFCRLLFQVYELQRVVFDEMFKSSPVYESYPRRTAEVAGKIQ